MSKFRTSLDIWDFESALSFLHPEADKEDRRILEALVRVFGNGSVLEGDLGTIVDVTVRSLYGARCIE